MKIILGSENLKSPKFYELAFEKKFLSIDTADSYHAGQAEKIIGEIVKKNKSHLEIQTKIGGYRSKLPYPMNLYIVNSKAIQKYRILRDGRYSDFNLRIKPKELSRLCKSSLQRMGIDQLTNYFLHGYPDKGMYEDFVTEMIALRDIGLAKSIGMSVSHKNDFDINWCDVIQVPSTSTLSFRNFTGRIQVNHVFRGSQRTTLDAVKELKLLGRDLDVVLGTSKVERIVSFQNYWNSEA